MSPEQAEGRHDQLGPATDIYSLGATLYCLLTAKAPFEGPDADAILAQVRAGAYPRPRQVNRGVPPALEAICLKAMALRPEDRYRTPRALADDVERWLADEPVSVYRAPWTTRLARWALRHKTLVAASAALLLTAFLALAIGTVLLRREQARTEANRLRAVAAQDRAEADFKVARQAVDQILARVAGPDLAHRPQTDKLRIELAGKALGLYQQLHAMHREDPGMRAALARASRTTAKSPGTRTSPTSAWCNSGWRRVVRTRSRWSTVAG